MLGAGSVPTPRAYYSAAAYNGNIFIFGGELGPASVSNEFFVFDPETNVFRQIFTELEPGRRKKATLVCHGDRLILYGGFETKAYYNDMYRFDFGTGQWDLLKVKGAVPEARAAASVALVGDRMFVFGGHSPKSLPQNDLHYFDCDSLTWNKKRPLGFQPTARYSHTATEIGGAIFVFAGCTGDRAYANDLLHLDVSAIY